MNDLFDENSFGRRDESDDSRFYDSPRYVDHLDSPALSRVEKIVGELVPRTHPKILDLMASVNSHLAVGLDPRELVGLGLNQEELQANKKLSRFVIQDLNRTPRLPFPENSFDVVLNTLSIAYITRPFEIFTETGRVLKKGGLLLVIFSNRMFPEKAVNIWRDAKLDERILLTGLYFKAAGCFDLPSIIASEGDPIYNDANNIMLKGYGDPVYAIYARKGASDGDDGLPLSSFPNARLDISRKPVTALVLHFKNFASLAESLAPQQVVSLLSRCYAKAQQIVRQHGGTICRFEKDFMLGVFPETGDPPAADEKALVCAAALREVVPASKEDLQFAKALPMEVGIGLASGESVSGKIPFVRGQRYSSIGQPITRAFKNAASAGAGQINLCSRIYSTAKRLSDIQDVTAGYQKRKETSCRS